MKPQLTKFPKPVLVKIPESENDGYITAQQKRNLIGIPMASTLERCDLCGDDFPLRELEFLGRQFLCQKCKSER